MGAGVGSLVGVGVVAGVGARLGVGIGAITDLGVFADLGVGVSVGVTTAGKMHDDHKKRTTEDLLSENLFVGANSKLRRLR